MLRNLIHFVAGRDCFLSELSFNREAFSS